jgi:threonylcarbamoyladenosine tRNA methylthiotransferase MtaB
VKTTRTIAYHTLGCKLNFAETSSVGRDLASSGYKQVDFSDTPDVYLINTCSVTENADRECRTIVSRALAINPEAIVVVTGCFAQLRPDHVAAIPGVDLVLGAGEKFDAPAYIDKLIGKGTAQVMACDVSSLTEFKPSRSAGDRTRVFLKVQDGCDYNCSFCTIPLARGKSRSNPIGKVLDDAHAIIASGAQEIVLTGVNLGDFGIQDPVSNMRASTFYELASALDELNGINRIRISSIEPNLLDRKIIELVAKSKVFVPHFHIPLQSGSDRILKSMRRRYLTHLYRERIETIRALIPGCCIGADVIVGFPGETEADFNQTYDFLCGLDVSYLHVFTYSERDNTLAAEMDSTVPMPVRKDRNRQLRVLSGQKLLSFYNSQLGTRHEVLFEADHKYGWMHGFTRNYVKVRVPHDPELINRVVPVILDSVNEEGTMNVTMYQTANHTN